MRPGPAPADDGRLRRLHRHHLDPGVLLFQKLARARDRPARADPGDQHVDPPPRLRPDLRARRLVVHPRVGRVLELLQHQRAGRRGRDLLGLGDRALHARGRVGQHERRAERLEQHAALDRHRGGHREHELVALGGRDERERDARVARGGLDERGAPRRAEPGGLGGLDHRAADAVFFPFFFCA